MKWKDTEFERQLRIESLIARDDAGNRRQPYRGGGSSPRAPEKSTNTPGSADSLLSHVEIMATSILKILNHFLACEIDSRVAARTYHKRKKQGSAATSKVKLERNMPKVNTADTNIVHCCSQEYLSLSWYT